MEIYDILSDFASFLVLAASPRSETALVIAYSVVVGFMLVFSIDVMYRRALWQDFVLKGQSTLSKEIEMKK